MNLLLKKFFQKIYIIRTKYLKEKDFVLILSFLIGMMGGFIALTLKYGVYFLHRILHIDIIGDFDNHLLLLLPAIGILLTLIFRNFILKDTIKHNIASILHAISKRNSLMKWHKTFSSVLGGIITAGFGGSVGLEAPIISSGAAIGSNMGRLLRLNYKTVTILLACGATGAISAIFHTPIAAIVFALEVLMIDLSRFTLIPLLIASITGSLITNLFYGEVMLFNFVLHTDFVVSEIPLFALLGILMGLLSVYFSRAFIHIETRFEEIESKWNRWLIGGLIIGLLIYLFPPLLSEGFHTMKAIVNQNYNWVYESSFISKFGSSFWLIILFFSLLIGLKVVATAITIGSGGVGGVFAPSLFTGAIGGMLFAKLLNHFFPGSNYSEVNFALVGMAGMLGGVLHAPLTGIFLIVEMTTDYELIVPLMLTTTISFLTVKYFQPNSIFTIQLARKGELITHNKDKAILTFMQLDSVVEKDLLVIDPDASLGDLVKVIAQSTRNIFPVVDESNHFYGVVLIENIRAIMFNQEMYQTSVLNLLIIPSELITTSDAMELVMKKFERAGAWNLPVVDNGKYIGYVSKSKLFNAYRNLLLEISVE